MMHLLLRNQLVWIHHWDRQNSQWVRSSKMAINKRVMRSAQQAYAATRIVFGNISDQSGSGLKLGQGIFWNGEEFVRRAFIAANDVDKLHYNIRSFREPLKRSLNEVIVPSIIQNFDVEGRPPWVALTPETIARRTR